MKIIKSFMDQQCSFAFNKDWEWGLGDDGLLYCRSKGLGGYFDTWTFACNLTQTYLGHMKITDMAKIVNQFNHLLVFL